MTYDGERWERFLPPFRSDKSESQFARAFADDVVLVAGAGGSIGSALAQALARDSPRRLVLLDVSEHGLFELERSLETATRCEYVLGSVSDEALLEDVFRRWRPQVIFDAAAFKHVGLLERSPFAAIQNNVLGTDALLRAALQFGATQFVLVSTDKAVNPHSVMGVSKRIAELIVLPLSGGTFRASAIRLGNVIGSTGSVVPIFLEQIAKGGPVCVTDPEVTRYFLAIDEAVSAILAAGAAHCDGKVLVPELGSPVRVADLARFLVQQQGGNTPLCFTGLRPGEKLSEDLLGAAETMEGTVEGPLTVLSGPRLSSAEREQVIQQLAECLRERSSGRLLQTLCRLVPEYVPSQLMQATA